MMQMVKAFFIILFSMLVLSACVYKINVQQGNVITDKAINQLQVGMSSDQVRALFGDPLLKDVYHGNSLTYVYTMKQGNHPMTRRQVTIYFVNDKVTRYTTAS